MLTRCILLACVLVALIAGAAYWFGSGKLVISAAVVPHHDMVAGQRETFFKELGETISEKPESIILVSPNHYESGRPQVQLSDERWETSAGTIEPNLELIQNLAADTEAEILNSSFYNEHGIRTILQDIARIFPETTIVPIILRSNTRETQVDELAIYLSQHCQKCLLIASVDFSHYQPVPIADIHDEFTNRSLATLDKASILAKVEVDSRAALALMTTWARLHNTERWNRRNHTNSGTLVNQPDIETTSHFFGWYERGEHTSVEPRTSFTTSAGLPQYDEEIKRRLYGTDDITSSRVRIEPGFLGFRMDGDILVAGLADEATMLTLVGTALGNNMDIYVAACDAKTGKLVTKERREKLFSELTSQLPAGTAELTSTGWWLHLK